MRIEELSVGDWVKYKEREWQVFSLDKFTGEVGLWRKDSQLTEDVTYIEPIPLTPEILEKSGFEPPRKNVMFDTWTYKDAPMFISLANSKYTDYAYYMTYEREGLRGLNQMSFPIYNVHELQHALRLAGIEKEIEV